MYKVIADFINDNWFATGLTPTLRILNYDGTLLRQVDMIEVAEWSYKYEFTDINPDKLYFFKMDAGTDDVIWRYKSATNQIEDATSPTRNVFRQASRRDDIDGIMDKKMDMFWEKFNNLPKQEPTPLDNTEFIGTITKIILEKIENNKTDIDYAYIDNIVSDKISNIKFPEIPTQKETDISPIQEWISKLLEEFKSWLKDIYETVYPLVDDRNKKKLKKDKEIKDKIMDKIANEIIKDNMAKDLLLKML